MSLKVPKNNNLQLFKDGYKVIILPLRVSVCHVKIFLDAIRDRGRGPPKYPSCVRVIRSRTDKFWAEWYYLMFVPLAERHPDYGTGRNKLLINHLGRLFVTSDAATIIREIEVVHPAAKLLVMASQAQESEVCCIVSLGELTVDDVCGRWAIQQTWCSYWQENC